MLSVRLGPEQRAGLAVGGDFEGCLQVWRQHVVGRWRGAGAKNAIGQGDGALVDGWHGPYGSRRGIEIGRRVAKRRGVRRWWRAEIIQRYGVDGGQGKEHRIGQ
ncbi:hypothetical protein D3C85_1190130 [compost metagenome]